MPTTVTSAADAASLPDLNSEYPLSAETIAAYQRDGHALVRGAASPSEIAVYGPAIERAADAYKTEKRALSERDTYGKAFLQIMNLWRVDEAVRRFTLARRFAKIAADLMGVDGIRLYHDQALFKEPGGGPTPWHQDQFYWPLDTDSTITMWMPLVDVPVTMGALSFASGSQREGYLGEMAISDASDAYFENLVSERGFPRAVDPMAAGDATFHSGWTLHNAPGNPTNRIRSVFTVIYFADGTRIKTPDNANRQADLETWLPGLKPGDIAASELNPLVYKT